MDFHEEFAAYAEGKAEGFTDCLAKVKPRIEALKVEIAGLKAELARLRSNTATMTQSNLITTSQAQGYQTSLNARAKMEEALSGTFSNSRAALSLE